MLGPILFSIFIHDIHLHLTDFPNVHIKAFADDIKLFVIFDKDDRRSRAQFQNILDQFSAWVDTLQLKLAVQKCNVLHLGKHNPRSNYFIANHILNCVSDFRDLGVIVSQSLSNQANIQNRYKKAMSQLALMLRAVSVRDKDILLRCYQTYVLPIVEFGSQVWSPFLALESKRIEKVQEFFTRVVYYRCFPSTGYPKTLPSYSERCRKLGLQSLALRRVFSDLVLAFKIMSGRCILKFSCFYRYRFHNGRRGSHSFPVENTKVNTRYYAFSLRTSRWLNMLSAHDFHLLKSKTVRTFKKRLRKIDLCKVLKLPTKF